MSRINKLPSVAPNPIHRVPSQVPVQAQNVVAQNVVAQSVSIQGPTLGACQVRGYLDPENHQWSLDVYDLLHECGYKTRNTIASKVKTYGEKFVFHQHTANHIWTEGKWAPFSEMGDNRPFVAAATYALMVTTLLKRARTDTGNKQLILQRLGITPAVALDGPIECNVLIQLEQACPWEMIRQYTLGTYRIDAYFPRMKLAIEIDEHGHSDRDPQEEKRRDTVLKDHDIVLLRFNPHDPSHHGQPGLALIKQVWSRTSSPDFVSFREKHQLK